MHENRPKFLKWLMNYLNNLYLLKYKEEHNYNDNEFATIFRTNDKLCYAYLALHI